MKLHLPLSLRTSLLSMCALLAAGTTNAATDLNADGIISTAELWAAQADEGGHSRAADWGNTLYIGDSISHGFNVQPYRWFLFKNLVDNGISQTEAGIQTGYYHSAVSQENAYGSATFDNLHATQSGITAKQVAGEGTGKLDGSGLADWLGQDSSYSGSYHIHTANDADTLAIPSTAFIMIGTNDIFNATGTGYLNSSTLETHTANMTRYLSTMVTALKQANADVNIVINAIPTWSENRAANSNGKAENWQALSSLNASLKEWVEEQDGVTFLDINKGIIDVANTAKPGAADVAFCSDTQHPNAQGNLIIAGNMAQQLGYAGRTAGQLRVDAVDTSVFTHQTADIFSAESTTKADISLSANGLELAHGATLSTAWDAADDLENGFTVDFSLGSKGLGNGSTDGWNSTSNFSLSVGDGTHAGTLNVNEAYIQWGDTILYSMDTSSLADALRVAYVHGNAAQGLGSGFYVWMGDMLIGEALSSSGSTNGLNLSNESGNTLMLTHLSMAAGAWAPTSTLYSYANPVISPAAPLPAVDVSMTMPSNTSGNTLLRNNAVSDDGTAITSGAVNIVVTGGSIHTKYLVGNQNDYTGDISITLTGEVASASNVTNDYNPLQYKGTLNGSISLLVDKDFRSSTTWGTFVGVDNGSVAGDIHMEFASSSLVLGNTSATCGGVSLAGTRGKNIGGSVSLLLRDGTYHGLIYGGDMNNSTSGGVTIAGGTSVTLEGGTFKGNVYAGGRGGTIKNGATLTIGGNVVLEDTVTLLSAGSIDNGRIEKGTTLIVKEVQEGSPFADYTGILDGGDSTHVEGTRELRFEKVQLPLLKATLQHFDAVTLSGKSDVALSSLGGATTLTVEAESRLALTGGSHTAIVKNSGTIAVEQDASLVVNGAGQDGNIFGRYELHGGSMVITGYDHLSTTIAIRSGSLSNNDGTVLDGGISIDATGVVALNGVALGDVCSLAVQEGGSITASLDSGNIHLDGISALEVTTDALNNKTIALKVTAAELTLGTSNTTSALSSLALGEAGNLSAGILNLTLSSELCSNLTTSGEGRLWVNQGTLNAKSLSLALASPLADNQEMTCTGIGSEGGSSYIGYRLYTTTNWDSTTLLGNGKNGEAIANQGRTNAELSSGNIAVSVNGGSMGGEYLVANAGAATGDVRIELGGEIAGNKAGGYNVIQWNGTLDGSIFFTLRDDFHTGETTSTWSSFIGADTATVTGDLCMTLMSDEFRVSDENSHKNRKGYAIAGSYQSSVNGKVDITIGAGEVTGNVMGGIVSGSNTIGKGTQVTLSGGTISGNVYGAGTTGIINGGSAVTVTGDAHVQSATAEQKAIISSGGSGGTINGGTLLVVKDVQQGAEGDRFSSFSGILSGNEGSDLTGTRTLCFDNAKLSNFTAELRNFDIINLIGQSDVHLTSLGNAEMLHMEEGSRLTLTEPIEFSLKEASLILGTESFSSSTASLNLVGESSLVIQTLTLNLTPEVCDYLVSAPAAMVFTDATAQSIASTTLEGQLLLGQGRITAEAVSLNLSDAYGAYTISSRGIETRDGFSYVNYSLTTSPAVPEPTAATLSLLTLAGAAARRRRK